MKAAVLHKFGTSPIYQDFAEPVPQSDDQILINLMASAIKNFDKLLASGRHPNSYKVLPAVVGFDGVGVLDDGRRVYTSGLTGMLAEKALIAKDKFTVLPNEIDDIVAAALPNIAMGAAIPILARGKFKKGQSILVNGATGATGRLAVQIAKHYGATKVIATGRNTKSLESLLKLGADSIVSLGQDDDAIVKQLTELNNANPIDVVIDYLWGHPIELVIKSLISGRTNPMRIVSVGDMAGDNINLSSLRLRTLPVEILGSGFGSLSADDWKNYNTEILPAMLQLASDKKLNVDTQIENLENIEVLWNKPVVDGKRLVMRIR